MREFARGPSENSAVRFGAEQAPRRPDRVLLGTTIAAKIIRLIRDKRLAPGDLLPSETELAGKYGVSQRVVRDAFRALSQQDIVRTRQGKRAVVGELRPVAVRTYFRLALEVDDNALSDLLELRLALETNATRLAALRATDDDLATLGRLLDEISSSGDDRPRRARLDLELHSAIVRAARNRFFDAILDVLSDALYSARERGVGLADHAAMHIQSEHEHRAITYALAARDTALAEQAMRMHLENVQRRFREPSA